MKNLSAPRAVGRRFLGQLTLLTAVFFAIGPFSALLIATIAAEMQPAEELKRQETWRDLMVKTPLPKKGIFEATYPDKVWKEITHEITPKPHPMLPRYGGSRSVTVGGGNNICAQAPTGLVSSATGSFDSVSPGISETGQVNNTGPQVANSYSIQLNTNTFTSTVAGSPPGCDGWAQFVYWNDGDTSTNSGVFIQYWLINYGTASPGTGWIKDPRGLPNWYLNSTVKAVPNQPISNLANIRLTGTVSATGDSYILSTGTNLYAGNGNNVVNAVSGWSVADFSVIGNGGGGQANFNSGAKIIVRTEIKYGGTARPTCKVAGYTAETNNLSFDATTPGQSPPGPAVIVEESNGGGLTANCAYATTTGDTHMTTFDGLFYDFQSIGDFVLVQAEPNFIVQARQVSGAPSGHPNTSVNAAVATQMGQTQVVVSVGPKLVIDGKITNLADGTSLSTADGVDISRRDNVYFITSSSGNSVGATVNANWVDLWVGLGQCCAGGNAKGLLANHNGNVNQLAARDGTVLNNPYTFEDLIRYGDSWRVSPEESVFDYKTRFAYAGRCGSFHLIGAEGSAAYCLGKEKYVADLYFVGADANHYRYQPAKGDNSTTGWAFSKKPNSCGLYSVWRMQDDRWHLFERTSAWGSGLGGDIAKAEKVLAASPTKPYYASDLAPTLLQQSRAIAKAAGVPDGPLLDAATLDVAVIGDPKAAQAFVGMPPPVAVGKIIGAK